MYNYVQILFILLLSETAVDKITHKTFTIFCGYFTPLVDYCRVEVTVALKDVNKKISEYQKKWDRRRRIRIEFG